MALTITFLKLKEKIFVTWLYALLQTSLHRTLVPINRYSTATKTNQLFVSLSMLCGILFLLSSCTKVVDINLNDAAKKYVIEGAVIDQPGGCKVKITQTVNFSETNNFPAVNGAIVTIKDNNNAPVTLTQTSQGTYQTTMITGVAGHTYTLSVNINGAIFSAISQMPPRANFDSLYITELQGFGNTTRFANVVFKDPAGKGNAYHFIQNKNGLQNKTVFILNDDFSDGRVTTALLADFGSDSDADKINKGDTVKVEMQCVDPRMYQFWYSLEQGSTGNSNNSTPGNPVTNINGGALGYFSAHTVQSKTIIVP